MWREPAVIQEILIVREKNSVVSVSEGKDILV